MKELLARIFSRPVLATELVAASLFANILALASPIFVIQVLNRYVSYGVDSTLATLTAGVLIAVLLEFGFRQVRFKMAGAVSAPFDARFSAGAFGILTGAKSASIEQLPPGIRREVVMGGDSVQAAYGASNVTAVLDLPFALLFVLVLFLLSPALAVVVGTFLVLVFAVAVLLLSSLRRPTRDLTTAAGRRGGLLDTAIQAGDALRAFNLVGHVRELWRGESEGIHGLKTRIASRQGLVQSLTQSAQAAMSVAVIAIGAMLVVAGEMDVGAMIGANILAARALGPVARFAQMGQALAQARQATDLYREFIKVPQERTEGAALGAYSGGLEFKDVAFAYPGAKGPLFESVSFKLEPGSVLVGAGANGAGKTTLARLLVGVLEPTRGQILADGLDLVQAAPEWWRKQVIYLPQEPAFLNASIRDNLLAVKPDLDEADLSRLVTAAGLRTYIERSPEGFDQVLRSNGANLSLGIRRRLALARALAHEGMLVVVDEPTEGLDAEGSKQVYAVLNDLARKGRTIIAFSHDPQIVKGARYLLDLNVKPEPRFSRVQKGKEETK